MGLATRMKLVVSMLVGTTLAGLSESLALSTKLGLNITDVLEVLRYSSANSQFIQEKGTGKYIFTLLLHITDAYSVELFLITVSGLNVLVLLEVD